MARENGTIWNKTGLFHVLDIRRHAVNYFGNSGGCISGIVFSASRWKCRSAGIRAEAFWQGILKVTAGNEAISKVKIEKRSDGKFFYALTFRGVTRPLVGPFPNPFEAAAAGEAALKALEGRVGAPKA
ncbi:hypothetical protein MUO32_05760 [Shinella sp. CPCC 101442]|uniref:hypothetical protein n=1 Tax=Shinella sp. CPCC 101442 TaxID=2932265 RepID=UPI002152F74A|nr:hypothetical protein [Shinella sp. CPCC 101442]MCR6498529.1 hypothetical protein [Shinella sp. CPCC 101442]